jgi:hypothetical protein
MSTKGRRTIMRRSILSATALTAGSILLPSAALAETVHVQLDSFEEVPAVSWRRAEHSGHSSTTPPARFGMSSRTQGSKGMYGCPTSISVS